MNEIEKMIQKQNELVQKLNYPGTLAIASALKSNEAFSVLNVKPEMITSIYESSALRMLKEEPQIFHNIIGETSIRDSFFNYTPTSILGDYSGIADLTRISKYMEEILEPIWLEIFSFQDITPVLESFTQLSPVLEHIWEEPSLLEQLHNVIGNQIDTSLWDYYDSIDERDEEIEEDVIAQFTEIIKSPDMKGKLLQFIADYGEKGKKIIVSMFKTIIAMFFGAFFSGLVAYCCEPIYKVVTPSSLHCEENENSEEV